MGECGCSQFQADFRMPGPDGTEYAIMVYPGCHYCGTPVGIDIRTIRPRTTAARFAGLTSATKLDFNQEVDGGKQASIPIVHIDKIWKLLGDEYRHYLDARDVEIAVQQTVAEFRKGQR